jgi:hypothetical protein
LIFWAAEETTMNARKRMQVLADKASNIVDRVEAEGRGRTPEEDRAIAGFLAELKVRESEEALATRPSRSRVAI